MYYGESVDCNIIMWPVIQCYLLSLQVLQNQQIVVLQPWLCGSVNHTAKKNKHHEEESRPCFCCSAQLYQTMHWPGYVQGGRKLVEATCCQGFIIEEFVSDTATNQQKIFFFVSLHPLAVNGRSETPFQAINDVTGFFETYSMRVAL